MAKKTTKRGGKRPGAGRPRKDDAKTSVFSVAVTAEELELLRRADAKSWARKALVDGAKRRLK
jgi:hypothetical protein